CKVAGMGIAWRDILSCDPMDPVDATDSMTVLVNSSTNKGTPSVLATICCTTSGGRALPPVTRSTIVSTSERPKRLSVIWLRYEWAPQGGGNSGRKVSRVSIRAVGDCLMKRCNNSNVEGSAQCRSSQAQYTAALSASSMIHATNASCAFCFCFCGLSVRGGIPSGCGNESKVANSGRVSAWGE